MNNILILAQKLEECKKIIMDTGESSEMADGIISMIYEGTGLPYRETKVDSETGEDSDILLDLNSKDVDRLINHIDDLFASYPKTKMKLI